jgi:hypothetical protein
MDKSNLATGSVSAWPKGLVLLAIAALAAAVLWGTGTTVVQADPPTFDSHTTAFLNTAGADDSLTIDVPNTAQAGDLLVAVVCVDDNHAIAADPDWTLLDSAQLADVSVGVWYQIVGAGTDASYAFTWTGDEEATGSIMLFTDVDADPIGVHAEATGDSNIATAPAITTTADDALALRLACWGGPGVTLDSFPAEHTVIFSLESSNAAGATTAAGAFEVAATAGDVGTAAFDMDGNVQANQGWISYSIEILPFVPPTPTPTATNTATATNTPGPGTPTNTPGAGTPGAGTPTNTPGAGTPGAGTPTNTPVGGAVAATQTAQAGPPHLGAIVGAGRQATATPRPAQQQPSTAGAISPPRTGDGGLVEQSRGLDAVVLVLLTISVTSAGLALSRKLSRQQRGKIAIDCRRGPAQSCRPSLYLPPDP